jgi:hypothetical protein
VPLPVLLLLLLATLLPMPPQVRPTLVLLMPPAPSPNAQAGRPEVAATPGAIACEKHLDPRCLTRSLRAQAGLSYEVPKCT